MKKIITPPDEVTPENIRAFFIELCNVINDRFGNIPDDSDAVDTAGAVSDLNDLLEVLR